MTFYCSTVYLQAADHATGYSSAIFASAVLTPAIRRYRGELHEVHIDRHVDVCFFFVSVQHVCVVEHVERYHASRERATGLASSKTLGRNLLYYSRRKIVMVILRFPVDRLANLRSAIGSIRASERLSLSSPEEDSMRLASLQRTKLSLTTSRFGTYLSFDPDHLINGDTWRVFNERACVRKQLQWNKACNHNLELRNVRT